MRWRARRCRRSRVSLALSTQSDSLRTAGRSCPVGLDGAVLGRDDGRPAADARGLLSLCLFSRLFFGWQVGRVQVWGRDDEALSGDVRAAADARGQLSRGLLGPFLSGQRDGRCAVSVEQLGKGRGAKPHLASSRLPRISERSSHGNCCNRTVLKCAIVGI